MNEVEALRWSSLGWTMESWDWMDRFASLSFPATVDENWKCMAARRTFATCPPGSTLHRAGNHVLVCRASSALDPHIPRQHDLLLYLRPSKVWFPLKGFKQVL
jgi:hypothetical protein